MRTSSRSGTLVAVNRPFAAGMTIGIIPSGLLEFGLLGLTETTSKAGGLSWAWTGINVRLMPNSAMAAFLISTPTIQLPNHSCVRRGISEQGRNDPDQLVRFIDDRILVLRQHVTTSQNPETKPGLLE